MILYVDIGNTRLKWLGEAAGQALVRGAFVHRDGDVMAQLQQAWSDLPLPARVLVVSVAGEAMASTLAQWVQRQWGLATEFVHSRASGFGVVNAYAEPARMGADRWVAMVAARGLTRGACCAIDCGTAVTVDVLSAQGRHEGGVIFPGLQLMRLALYRDTQRIPAEPASAAPVALLGHDTASCVASGVQHAVAGGIARVVESARARVGASLACFITGGDGPVLAAVLGDDYRLHPDLLFEGLRRIAAG